MRTAASRRFTLISVVLLLARLQGDASRSMSIGAAGYVADSSPHEVLQRVVHGKFHKAEYNPYKDEPFLYASVNGVLRLEGVHPNSPLTAASFSHLTPPIERSTPSHIALSIASRTLFRMRV